MTSRLPDSSMSYTVQSCTFMISNLCYLSIYSYLWEIRNSKQSRFPDFVSNQICYCSQAIPDCIRWDVKDHPEHCWGREGHLCPWLLSRKEGGPHLPFLGGASLATGPIRPHKTRPGVCALQAHSWAFTLGHLNTSGFYLISIITSPPLKHWDAAYYF